ncbi:MAG: membrane dipeptidase [Clostridia bacterium]|nr:membrane dipeptidase [Clostridia bacterium]
MILIDTHADTLHRRAVRPGDENDVTADRLRRGGVTVQTMALFVGGSPVLSDIARTFDLMWQAGEKMKRESGLAFLTDYRDAAEGESAFLYSVEGCDLLNGDLALLSDWRERGVRMAALTWNYPNCVGTPAKVDADTPLTPFGREAAREMARLGIAPDTSHLNRRGFYDLLEMGLKPLASHSCCAALCGHCRNLTDDQLKALFQAGGYVGVNFYPYFLSENGKADLDTVCDHVLRMLDMGGEGKIGFGSDFDGIECKPQGLSGPQDFPALLDALRRRGVTEPLLRGIAGENLLRYYDRIDPR